MVRDPHPAQAKHRRPTWSVLQHWEPTKIFIFLNVMLPTLAVPLPKLVLRKEREELQIEKRTKYTTQPFEELLETIPAALPKMQPWPP